MVPDLERQFSRWCQHESVQRPVIFIDSFIIIRTIFNLIFISFVLNFACFFIIISRLTVVILFANIFILFILLLFLCVRIILCFLLRHFATVEDAVDERNAKRQSLSAALSQKYTGS